MPAPNQSSGSSSAASEAKGCPAPCATAVGARSQPRAGSWILAGELAATQVPVAADDDQHHRGERDQKPVLDVADVIAAPHCQQKQGEEEADAVPHPRRAA